MAIFLDDGDRLEFLGVLAKVAREKQLVCYAYCLMGNHYHAVVATMNPNLSSAMRQLNGDYASWWNDRHGHVGHVFQGRFNAQIVEDDTYLVTACTYDVLNPVRAGLVELPEQWPWSSYRATAGLEAVPDFLSPKALWERLGPDPTNRYREHVAAALGTKLSPDANPRRPRLRRTLHALARTCEQGGADPGTAGRDPRCAICSPARMVGWPATMPSPPPVRRTTWSPRSPNISAFRSARSFERATRRRRRARGVEVEG